jgi:nucleoside-diphosphate-sugar epimerase
VIGVDTGYYAEATLFPAGAGVLRTLRKDIRHLEPSDIAGCDAVVHMAELSNDPAAELLPDVTFEINHAGSVRLARTAHDAGVTRFVYMSSCSVYGVADAEMVDEGSRVDPQTVYAVCKTLVERDVGALADARFSPTFLRNATAYGASPHMRFDIVLNNLAGWAWTARDIRMTSDGTPWRPLVHGRDIAAAIGAVLEAPREAVHGQVFNVGDTAHNYTVREIAEHVASVFPDCRVSFGPPSKDNRSYRVSFEKIRRHLPGFRCAWDARRGAAELLETFRRSRMTAETFQHRVFTRLAQLKYLVQTGQLDEHFHWRT